MNDSERLRLRMEARRQCGISKIDAETLERLFQEFYYGFKSSSYPMTSGIILAVRGRPPKIRLRA